MEPVSSVEATFIENSAKDGIRVDGRGLTELRDVSIKLSRTYTQTSSIVSYGDTKACAITKCQVVEPRPEFPDDGKFYIHVQLTPMGGREYATPDAVDIETELERILERSLKDNNTVDVESLCIIPGESVFQIDCYVSIIDNSGNIFDAAVLAATSSLCHFRRPEYTIDGKQVRIYSPEEKEPVPICLHYQPICVTFSILKNSIVLLDPSEREEAKEEGKVSIILNAFGDMCGFHFFGGIPVDSELLLKCVNIASIKAQDISQILKAALAQNSL